jgi:hypothetical protein
VNRLGKTITNEEREGNIPWTEHMRSGYDALHRPSPHGGASDFVLYFAASIRLASKI